uniref:Uncharacterized protein n=1 Tax=Aegilops tauschii subsp. strangulata TaxID=200361 RepID=A0A453N914_AEGTS
KPRPKRNLRQRWILVGARWCRTRLQPNLTMHASHLSSSSSS